MKLAHPDDLNVRREGARHPAAGLTCRWRDIALDGLDRPLQERYEEMAQLASLAIARAYYLEHEPPVASVTSLDAHRRRTRKEAPERSTPPGA